MKTLLNRLVYTLVISSLVSSICGAAVGEVKHEAAAGDAASIDGVGLGLSSLTGAHTQAPAPLSLAQPKETKDGAKKDNKDHATQTDDADDDTVIPEKLRPTFNATQIDQFKVVIAASKVEQAKMILNTFKLPWEQRKIISELFAQSVMVAVIHEINNKQPELKRALTIIDLFVLHGLNPSSIEGIPYRYGCGQRPVIINGLPTHLAASANTDRQIVLKHLASLGFALNAKDSAGFVPRGLAYATGAIKIKEWLDSLFNITDYAIGAAWTGYQA